MTQLRSPLFISSRLMAAVEIDGAEVSIGQTGRAEDRYGKPVWNWIVELETGETLPFGAGRIER